MDIHDTIALMQIIITALAAVAASSGFWLYMEKKSGKKDLSRRLLCGLAHDRIIYLSLKYIKRGWITQDEYENLCEFLYTPYIEIGGNGATKRLMQEVDKLPIRHTDITDLTNIMKGTYDDSQQGL